MLGCYYADEFIMLTPEQSSGIILLFGFLIHFLSSALRVPQPVPLRIGDYAYGD